MIIRPADVAILLTFQFLPRWKEAGGFDGACGSCESLTGGQTNTGIISGTTGGGHGNTGTGNTGTGTGNTGGGPPASTNPIKKIPWFRGTRDVSQQEGMCFKKYISIATF